MGVAELYMVDFGGEELFAFLDGLPNHLQEPQNPFGEVAARGLRARENFEVVGLVVVDLLVQRVLAMRCAFGSGELHCGNGACDSSVCIGEGADGEEPKVRDGGFDDSVHACVFKPRQKVFHFALEAFWIRACKVERFGGRIWFGCVNTRLHFAGCFAVVLDFVLPHGGVPVEKSFFGQGQRCVLYGSDVVLDEVEIAFAFEFYFGEDVRVV